MKTKLILMLGVLAGAISYGAIYFVSTAAARELRSEPAPELAWLKQEFNLGQDEYKRIGALHEAYLPQCRAMCAKIDAKNAEVRGLLEKSTNLTADIQSALKQAADLRAQCQAQMLSHFFEVSRSMPPEQGKRYLTWVTSKTLHGNGGMDHEPESHGH